MAKLMKEKARKPIMEQCAPLGSKTTLDGKTAYRLDLYPADSKERSWEVVLTRAEMLAVVQSWLAAEASMAKDAERRTQLG